MADAILSHSGIYVIKNQVNGKIYVGSAVNIASRWRVHVHKLRKNEHHSPRLQNAWNKYGEQSFIFSVLEVVVDKSQLISREQHWLDTLKPSGRSGYNVSPTAMSRLGVKMEGAALEALRTRMRTPEMREKMRAARGDFKHTPESIQKMSAANKGKLNSPEAMQKCWDSNIGRKHPPEFGEKVSQGKKGWVPSDQTRKKWTEIRTGRKQSDETKAKRSAALKGRPRPPEVIAQIIATKKAKRASA